MTEKGETDVFVFDVNSGELKKRIELAEVIPADRKRDSKDGALLSILPYSATLRDLNWQSISRSTALRLWGNILEVARVGKIPLGLVIVFVFGYTIHLVSI